MFEIFYLHSNSLIFKNFSFATGKFRIEDVTGSKLICDRTTKDGQLECSNMLVYTEVDDNHDTIRYAETIAIASSLFSGWSIMAGIITVTDNQADHDRLSVRLYDTHQNINVFYDDISIKPVLLSCENLVLNGNFESGDSRF